MFEEEDKETGYAVFLTVTLAIVISLFVIAIAIGGAIGQAGDKPTAAPPQQISIVKIIGVVYFEVGKADPPADVMVLLGPAIRMARSAPSSKLVLSGYHDTSGDAAANEELAKRRALSIRGVLMAAGIGEQRIELAKPVVTTGGSDPNEARRVEVTLR